MALRETDPAEVGGYRIEDRLGSGGMGVVYLARSASGRRLALKVVHAQYADDDEFRIRFRREVAAARQVSGAFTAPVVDADADAPRPWMATLYIPGEDLGTHVRRHGPLPLPKLRELAAGLSEALRDIHRAGMIHRDLKPANVMLAEDGPRVIDFGISRAAEFAASDVLTQTGRVMGTPPYMSPEQFSSPQEVGPAADVFSLGSVLAYAATGRGPFDSPSPYETALRVVDGDAELDGVPDELLPFIRLCLEKHPKSRPTTTELLTLLRDGRLPDPRPEPGPATTPDEPSAPRRRRRSRLLLVSALSALLLAAATTVTVVAVNAEPTPAARDLPAGWRAWQAKDTHDPEGFAGGSFTNCAVADGGLICAGDDVKAARFELATGRVAWSSPVDPTPDETGSSEGEVLGTNEDRVYVYENNEVPNKNEPGSMIYDYSIQGLDARSGSVLWSRRVWHGTEASAPSIGPGGAQSNVGVVPQGVLSADPVKSMSYTLLDAATGKPRWRRSLPKADICDLRAVAGNGYLLCSDAGGERARVIRIDPATGAPRWTVGVSGSLTLVGQADGRLLFVDDSTAAYGSLTAIDVADHTKHTVRLARPVAAGGTGTVSDGTVFFTTSSGRVQAVDPRTGRRLWDTRSSVESPGPPLAFGAYVIIASPGGRLAALDRDTGRERDARPSPGGDAAAGSGLPITRSGDALYVPYGVRSVYSVDAANL
ncbi:serine/threonine-protein kinase [Streptomyces bicolor]|uniref:serine/threonine-protein kinase n=1 Tax=Streptomyces bicolor TaxID=66874 RepID=UPI0004E119F6|nr:serine/threonine-protein kinase [Streptomyces bicolor]